MLVSGKFFFQIVCILVMLSVVAGCQPVQITTTLVVPVETSAAFPSQTPFQPQPPTLQAITPTPTPHLIRLLGFQEGVPEKLRQQISLVDDTAWAEKVETSDFILSPLSEQIEGSATWVYALVAPFDTIQDEISSEALTALWHGETSSGWENVQLYLSKPTHAMLESLWGPGNETFLRIASDFEDLISQTWANQPSLAIVPFEELDPRWKVLRIDGLSPLQKTFAANNYFLTSYFSWIGQDPGELPELPVTNRIEDKLTVITMTGVTALVRATGFMMDKYGVTFPGEDIQGWMKEADFTHVSNEVSFDPTCPAQDPNQQGLRFCSRPEYIELLEFVGVDIVELTGNHLMDFRPESLPYTMELYRQRGWTTFGGGENIEVASQPGFIEHNGNRFALLGCNPAGPGGDWAGPGNPGTQPCDWDAFRQQIRELTDQGYLVITTLQYAESYSATPGPQQVADFRSLSEAGAVIVSGSQAHFPQGFEFLNGKLIHYGLGNLFFDQMDYPVVGTRREFLDRHIFYDGRHISTELLTALLENYARPRPMTAEERQVFLQDIFSASGW